MSVERDAPSPYAPPAVSAPLQRAAPVDPAATLTLLRTLGVLHHVLGALSLFGTLSLGLFLLFGISHEAATGFSDPSGIAMIAVVGMLVVLSLLGGALCIWAGLHLMRQTRLGLCTAVAALCCLNVPLGTALGISTLLILQRHEVRAAFAGPRLA